MIPANFQGVTKPITLALGGGGARGVAHLGAIEEIIAADYPIERIVGVSIGALVGAMYAFDPDLARVQRRACEFLHSTAFQRHQKQLFGARMADAAEPAGSVVLRYRRLADALRTNRLLYRAVRHSSLVAGELLEQVVNVLLPDADIRDAEIPLSIVAVDLHTGQLVNLDSGPVRDAARASASVPGIFPPVSRDAQLLTDIGGFASLPLEVARSYAPETLFAIDVGSDLRPMAKTPSAVEILLRMNDIGAALFRERIGAQADLLIRPDVGHVDWFDFTKTDALVAAGRQAARAALIEFVSPQRWMARLTGDAAGARHREVLPSWEARAD